jgi:hypothetical protein
MLGPLRKRLPLWPLLVGCLLPDLIDKPLYYLTPPTELISGSRTFGHTLLFLVLLIAAAAVARSLALGAVAAGVATHLLLDIAGQFVIGARPESSIWRAIFWPAFHGRFPEGRFSSLSDHLRADANIYVIAGELLGGALLLQAWWRGRRQSA